MKIFTGEEVMKTNIIKLLLCLLSFTVVLGISVAEVYATSIVFRSPIVLGALDKRSIQKIMRSHEGEIRHCYEMALIDDKTLTGKMSVRFVILSNNGLVEEVEIAESTLGNPEVEQCVVDHIGKWKFYSIFTNGREIKFQVEYTYDFVSNYKPPTIMDHIRLILNEDDMEIEYLEELPAQSED